jgi:hypothetical protein
LARGQLACERARRPEEVLAIYEALKAEGLAADLRAHNMALRALAATGDFAFVIIRHCIPHRVM